MKIVSDIYPLTYITFPDQEKKFVIFVSNFLLKQKKEHYQIFRTVFYHFLNI